MPGHSYCNPPLISVLLYHVTPSKLIRYFLIRIEFRTQVHSNLINIVRNICFIRLTLESGVCAFSRVLKNLSDFAHPPLIARLDYFLGERGKFKRLSVQFDFVLKSAFT